MSHNFAQRQTAMGRLRAAQLQTRATAKLQDFHRSHLDEIDAALTEGDNATERPININPGYAQVLALLVPPEDRGPFPPPSIWYESRPMPSPQLDQSCAQMHARTPVRNLQRLQWFSTLEEEQDFHARGRSTLKITNPDTEDLTPVDKYIKDVSGGKIRPESDYIVDEICASRDIAYREELQDQSQRKDQKDSQLQPNPQPRPRPLNHNDMFSCGRDAIGLPLTSLSQRFPDVPDVFDADLFLFSRRKRRQRRERSHAFTRMS